LMQANQQIDSLKSFIEKLDSRLSTLETTTLEIFRNQLSQSEEREREKMRERLRSQLEEDERLAKQLQEQLSSPSSASVPVTTTKAPASTTSTDEKVYSCPVCGEKFPLYDQRTIEVHTNAHFDENEAMEYNKRRNQQTTQTRQPPKNASPPGEPGFFDKLFGASSTKKPTQPAPTPASTKLSQSQGGVPSSSPPHTFTQQPQMPVVPIGPLPTGSRLVSSAFPGQPIMYGVMPSNYYTYPYPLPQQPPQYADNATQPSSNTNINPPQYL